MELKKLLKESLLSVYYNRHLTEGIEDHPDALTSCITPQQLAKELNAEILRKDTSEKKRVSLGTKKPIYPDDVRNSLNKLEGEYDVFLLTPPETTKSGKQKRRKINFNNIVGSYNKEKGFTPTPHARLYHALDDSPNIPPDAVMFETAELDEKKFIALVTKKPERIFDYNKKMEKSDLGRNQKTLNTGLPAINGIIYDINEKKFRHINTCPSAGACIKVCYARKGFYGMNDGKILKLIRRLNLLWNDPEEYYNMIMDELEPTVVELKRKGRRKGGVDQLVIRWNDAGDFFSEKYFEIAQRVTNELLDSGFDVKSYAYTKQAKFVNLASEKFIMNFSKGAKKDELDKLDLEKVKFSDIVPSELFKKVFVYKGPHIQVDKDEQPIFKPDGKEMLRQLMSKEYNIPINRLKYQSELPSKEDEKFKYDVIVLPKGDSDIGAQRMDVHKTFLLVH